MAEIHHICLLVMSYNAPVRPPQQRLRMKSELLSRTDWRRIRAFMTLSIRPLGILVNLFRENGWGRGI